MKREKTALDRGRTDHISLTYDPDLELQSPVSYGRDLLTCKSSRSMGQSVPKMEWKQADGGDGIIFIHLPAALMRSVK